MKNDGALSGHPGSTYLLTQKFEFNWTVIGNMDKANDSLTYTVYDHEMLASCMSLTYRENKYILL